MLSRALWVDFRYSQYVRENGAISAALFSSTGSEKGCVLSPILVSVTVWYRGVIMLSAQWVTGWITVITTQPSGSPHNMVHTYHLMQAQLHSA